MHFRFRGNSVQIVKSQMDPATGKAKSIPLGSINRATFAISEKLTSNCSPGELREVEAWVKRYQKIDKLKRKVAAMTLPEQIAAAIAWFNAAPEDEAREFADEVSEATTALRRVLSRRGLA